MVDHDHDVTMRYAIKRAAVCQDVLMRPNSRASLAQETFSYPRQLVELLILWEVH